MRVIKRRPVVHNSWHCEDQFKFNSHDQSPSLPKYARKEKIAMLLWKRYREEILT